MWLLYVAYQFAGKVVGNALAYYVTKKETGQQDGASANRSFFSIFVVIGASAVAGYLVGRPW